MPGPYPFAFAHVSGYGRVPRVATLEAAGWVRVGEVPGLRGLWVMRRGARSPENTTSAEEVSTLMVRT